jgi:hypothetical protein
MHGSTYLQHLSIGRLGLGRCLHQGACQRQHCIPVHGCQGAFACTPAHCSGHSQLRRGTYQAKLLVFCSHIHTSLHARHPGTSRGGCDAHDTPAAAATLRSGHAARLKQTHGAIDGIEWMNRHVVSRPAAAQCMHAMVHGRVADVLIVCGCLWRTACLGGTRCAERSLWKHQDRSLHS